MSSEISVREGTVFKIELKSLLGSTYYGWCLKNLPSGVVLLSTESIPMYTGISPVIQTFYFGVTHVDTSENNPVSLSFDLLSFLNFHDVQDSITIKVNLIPHNLEPDQFIEYTNNCATYHAGVPEPIVKYGFPGCSPLVAYGYPCAGVPVLKYGYPTCPDTTVLKYGYPTCPDTAVLKYGYPTCPDNTVLKYGYPTCPDTTVLKYGYPTCPDIPVVEYGYPNCPDTTVLKYGYPTCPDNPIVKYGFPNCQ